MFYRLLWESFRRQRRRKALAGIAILLGTTAVTAMLALATTIGDRIHRELAVYGANIVVFPKADSLDVKVGGVDVKPATGGAYLKESDLEKLKGIFWANNITGVSPELHLGITVVKPSEMPSNAAIPAPRTATTATGFWFNKKFGALTTGAPQLHPLWKVQGEWPPGIDQYPVCGGICPHEGVVVGRNFATKHGIVVNSALFLGNADPQSQRLVAFSVSGIATTDSDLDNGLILTVNQAQRVAELPNAISRVEVSARTKPEDAFARQDPDRMSAKLRDVWYCRPYANSIAYQIREAIPGADAQQVRRVEQSEGTVLERISGLMWLISGAALLAAGFAVSAAMATAVLERRGEIGLMRSLGASKGAIATLFYAESGLLAVVTGTVGYLAGSALAWWLGARIFPGDGREPLLNLVLLPVIVAMALVVAVAGSTPAIRAALGTDPSATLRGDD